ncbi:hypothetical protein VTK56DRAFT_7921 [Thermocarpiscus australiensis]
MPSERFTLLEDTFLRSAYAVFDLRNRLHLDGNKRPTAPPRPRPLDNVQHLSAVIGACGLTNSAVSNASGTLAPSAGTQSSAGIVAPATTARPASGTSSPGRGQLTTSWASRCCQNRVGIVWGVGMAAALLGFQGV